MKIWKITIHSEWDWKTWGLGPSISANRTRPYHFGIEIGPFALWTERY